MSSSVSSTEVTRSKRIASTKDSEPASLTVSVEAIRRRWRIFRARRRGSLKVEIVIPVSPVGRFQVHGSAEYAEEWLVAGLGNSSSKFLEAGRTRQRERERERERERQNKPRCFRGRGELVGPAGPVYDSGMTLVEPARAARSGA